MEKKYLFLKPFLFFQQQELCLILALPLIMLSTTANGISGSPSLVCPTKTQSSCSLFATAHAPYLLNGLEVTLTPSDSSPSCPHLKKDNCNLTWPSRSDGFSGFCAIGYEGSCSYTCEDDQWSKLKNTCRKPPPSKFSCEKAVLSNCTLFTTDFAYSSGRCASGYRGVCGYGCTDRGWSELKNECRKIPVGTSWVVTQEYMLCHSTVKSNCILPTNTKTFDSVGRCAPRYTGTCGYVCLRKGWYELKNKCTRKLDDGEGNIHR